jgi:hypothetical protein
MAKESSWVQRVKLWFKRKKAGKGARVKSPGLPRTASRRSLYPPSSAGDDDAVQSSCRCVWAVSGSASCTQGIATQASAHHQQRRMRTRRC